jgi:hypothetical protein
LELFENSVMRIRFGSKRKEVGGHWKETAEKEI